MIKTIKECHVIVIRQGNNELNKNKLKLKERSAKIRDRKRKPAFNHPDHAGLISTSIVTSLQINLS